MKKHTPRLKEKYEKEIQPKLVKEFGLGNSLAAPRLTKIVVNMGVGDSIKNKDILKKASEDLAAITGQTPQVRPAKISVASFGLRAGMPVGLRVTLRGERMFVFLDKLISVVLPRFRDFRGVSLKSFDKGGNYTLGVSEHTVFPEADLSASSPRGLEVTLVTRAGNIDQSRMLLELLGMPFEKKDSE